MTSDPDIPAKILDSCEEALNERLPDKSFKRYLGVYEVFNKWQESNKNTSCAESVLLAYFRELSEKYKASTLWSTYSMLKTTIICNHKIDISNYSQLIAFLRKTADGFQSKKSKVFSADEVNKFLMDAPDDTYLAMKTVLVFGLIGASRGDELVNMKTHYVNDNESEIIVQIPHTTTKEPKSYIIDGEFAEIVRRYMKLRPKTADSDRFFLRYHNGNCSIHVMGKHTMEEIPKKIAKFLNLPECESYTGHSFSRASTTILADTGVGKETLKRHGQWKSSIVAEGYVKESLGHKRKIGSLIEETINLSSTSNAIDASQHQKNGSQRVTTASVTSPESSSVVNEGIIEESLTTACTMLVSQKIVTAAASENDDSLAAIEGNSEKVTQKLLLAFRRMSQPENSTFVPVKKLYAHRDAFKEGIPEKSYNRYVNNYETFVKWQELKEAKISFTEPVLLDYFREMSESKQPPSLWSIYSMLKTTMFSKQSIDISGYKQLVAFLKKNSDGYQSKRGKLFTPEDINKFMTEAPDDKYLAMKNLLVFGVIGVIGAWKGRSLTNLTIDQVKDYGNKIILTTAYPISKSTKEYVIHGQYAEAVRKYMQLRPRLSSTDRFFMQYRNGRCRDQVIGKNTLHKMPKEIAKFLKLPEYEAYTGYSFRTTTIIPVDTGVGMKTQHVQLKSSKIAEENVQESLGHKRNFRTLTAEETSSPSTSSESSSFEQDDISENSSLSESEEPSESNDKTALKRHHRTKASRHQRRKRRKIPEEMNWYDEECLTQIKLTADMFKRSANMGEDYKMKILSDFSIYRIELFKKYFAAMNTVAINPINTQTTAASINTAAQNGRVASSDFEFVKVEPKVEPLDNTNDISER